MMKRLLVLLALAGGLITHPELSSKGDAQTYPGSFPPNTIVLNEFPYSAACDGVTDDSSKFQAAITAAGGGTVILPAGKVCKINSGLTLGNGTSSTLSTINGTTIACGGNPVSTGQFGSMSVQSSCRILWGGAAGNVVSIAGPMQGWGLSNLIIDCNGTTSTIGLNLTSALNGSVQNVAFNNCARAINGITVPQFGSNDTNTENNVFINTVISMPNATSSGVVLTGNATDILANSHANTFVNLNIYMPSTAASFNPIVLQDADSNRFYGTVIFGGGGGCTAVQFAYTDHSIWPASNEFFGIDTGANLCATQFQNTGTPGASKPNYIIGVEEVNQTTVPNLANLAVVGSHQLVLAQPGNANNVLIQTLNGTAAYNFNLPTAGAGTSGQPLLSGGGAAAAMTFGTLGVAAGGTGDTGTAWGTYTPSPTCGSATITTNTARSKTLGKTTSAELDITITALGTCTNTFSFTLPNTPNSSAGLVGRQTAGSGANVNCYIPTGTATAFCASSAALTANQIVLSGTYENQ